MKTISISELRSRTRSLVRTLAGGKAVSLSCRGNKLANIWPMNLSIASRTGNKSAKPLTDREIDQIAYGL